jgi:hypothetical protein
MIDRRFLLGFGFCLVAGATAALAQTPTVNVRVKGTVEKLDGSMLTIKSVDGSDVAVRLADNFSVVAVAKASPADIKPGAYIGAGAKPQPDGTLRAVQVTIFPEAQRGVGEGHRAWDVLPDSTMTNATVSSTVEAVDGPTLTLTYKGGEKKLVIPADARVITYAPAEKTDLHPGAEVLAFATKQADGTLTSARVTVSKNGVPLPM